MRICVIGDLHMCRTSSIVRGKGERFSKRLENCISTLDWIENTSKRERCSMEIFLGDFFDTPDLDAETITAVESVRWNDTEKHFIVGNHESNVSTLEYNSANMLSKIGIIESSRKAISADGVDIQFIPYEMDDSREPLHGDSNKTIMFSHNDLKGLQYGMYVSKSGIDMDEIERNCRLFINGHLHNGSWVKKGKILNLGNPTGLNFSEDASKYPHQIAIIDTDTMSMELIENPYAFNFYKFDIDDGRDLEKLGNLKSNAIVSISCSDELVDDIRAIINSSGNVAESRVIVHMDAKSPDGESQAMDTINHLEMFKQFVLTNFGNSDIINDELINICG